jgi:hypothetical protein
MIDPIERPRFLHGLRNAPEDASAFGGIDLETHDSHNKCLNESSLKSHSEAFFAEESETTNHHLNNNLVVIDSSSLRSSE